MTRAVAFVACVGVLWLTSATAVRAEPIRITSGSLVFSTGEFTQAGFLSVFGTRGFSMQGLVPTDETNVDPVQECSLTCPPGSTIPVSTGVFASGFQGTATLDGKTYPQVDQITSLNHVGLILTGTADLPPFRATPVALRAPVAVTGTFRVGDVADPFSVAIHGQAILTMNLGPGVEDRWQLLNARYDFIATPTPEPATLLLVGGGILVAIRTRKPPARGCPVRRAR